VGNTGPISRPVLRSPLPREVLSRIHLGRAREFVISAPAAQVRGHFGDETIRVEPIDNPFGAKSVKTEEAVAFYGAETVPTPAATRRSDRVGGCRNCIPDRTRRVQGTALVRGRSQVDMTGARQRVLLAFCSLSRRWSRRPRLRRSNPRRPSVPRTFRPRTAGITRNLVAGVAMRSALRRRRPRVVVRATAPRFECPHDSGGVMVGRHDWDVAGSRGRSYVPANK
jgi:hypothetical protein